MMITLKHNDVISLLIEGSKGVFNRRKFTVGTAVGYALENGLNPIEEYNNDKAKGEPTEWLNLNATVVTTFLGQEVIKTHDVKWVEFGDKIILEGVKYTIVPEANGNAGFVAV